MNKNDSKSGIICLQPFYAMDFFYDKVYNCTCPDWIKFSIGDIKKMSIAEIWNSDKARFIRSKMYEGKWHDICNPICPHIIIYRREKNLIRYSDLERFDFLTPHLINEIRDRKDLLASHPTVFKLDNSNVCNLSCIMCSRNKYRDDHEMLTKTAEDILNYLPKARRVILTGLGETLARPDTRDLLINYKGQNPDFKFDIITNALLLPKFWEQIKHQKFGTLLISIDAATKETYEKIRKGGLWERLLESLALIKENGHRFSSVTINMTVMRENYREIPIFIDFAESYGFNVSFQRIRGTWGNQNFFETKDTKALKELREIIITENSKKRNINVFWGDILEFEQTKSKHSIRKVLERALFWFRD